MLTLPDLNITVDRQENFTQQFLDRLLCNVNDPTTWNNLKRLVDQQSLPEAALRQWRNYLKGLARSGRVTPGRKTVTLPGTYPLPSISVSRPASSPSWLASLKRLWDYIMADILVNA